MLITRIQKKKESTEKRDILRKKEKAKKEAEISRKQKLRKKEKFQFEGSKKGGKGGSKNEMDDD
jgi:hypothetical protein